MSVRQNEKENVKLTAEEIRKYWKRGERAKESDIKMWDSQADDPTYQHVYDGFVSFLKEEGMLKEDFDALDLGCGAGAYSIAVAGSVRSVTAVDISPRMLQNAADKREEAGIKNVEFIELDWLEADIDELKMRGRFDLVFAHNTPALCDADTFEKFNESSRRFCAVCAPIYMDERIVAGIRRLLGRDSEKTQAIAFPFMLDLLLQKRILPKFSYEKQAWPMKQTFDEACAFYLGRFEMEGGLGEEQKEKIKEYLRGEIKDGFIYDNIETTVATMYWEKTK